MKITLLHYAAPPVVGGVEVVIGHQARLMARAGHDVQIVAGRGEQVQQAVPFVPLARADSRSPDILALQAELNRGRVPREFSKIVDGIADSLVQVAGAADLLIAHNVCSLNKNLALTAALRKLCELGAGPKLALWHHDLAWTAPRYRDQLHDGYPWDLLRQAWPGVLQVTVSDFRRQEIAMLFGIPAAAIRVVPNGLEPADFYKLDDVTRQFVARLALLDAWPMLLVPVRITRRKNLEHALYILKALRERAPGAAMVITGPLGPHNPENREYFQQLLALRAELGLQEGAHFLAEHTAEYLPDSVIADFYRIADCLLLTSTEEGFGIPVLEAGLAAIPAFCADIPSLRELGGAHASYFDLNESPERVAELIARRLSADTSQLRHRVRAEYAWDQVYARHIEPLIESVGGRS